MVKMKERFSSSRVEACLPAGRGFTLIELLVVIAIIGLLAAVVLASVGGARTKGADASVKTQMANLRAAAELFASNNSNSYDGVCAALSSAANPGILTMLQSVDSAIAGGTLVSNETWPTTAAQAAGGVICGDAAGGWIAQGALSTAGTYWCSDSSGASQANAAALVAGRSTCP